MFVFHAGFRRMLSLNSARWLFASIVLLTSLLIMTPKASAHLNSIGYSNIELRDHQLTYELYQDPAEVSQWVDMRSEGVFVIDNSQPQKKLADNEVSWTMEELSPLLNESLTVVVGEETLEPTISDLSLQEKNKASYLHMKLSYTLPPQASTYSIDYQFFFDEDPNHQNFATIRNAGSSKDIVFNRGDHRYTADIAMSEEQASKTTIEVPDWMATMWEYIKVGFEHILVGTDHLLFIAALVLAKQRKWGYVKVLTAFTVGHSVTIALAALDIFTLSPSFVEPVIALSIAYVAIENIWLREVKRRWMIAFGFGLIHGFGFAEVLKDGMGDHFLLTLFSFNVGVELGQLAVLAILLPVLL